MRSVVLVLAIAGFAAATQFSDCGSVASDVRLEVPNCDQPPCTFKRGDSFPMSVSFSPKYGSEKLEASITAKIGILEVGWPGFDKDACKYLIGNQHCPYQAGALVQWTYEVDVLKIYPSISTVVTVKMINTEHQKNEVCLRVPVKIV
jgi:hypothetical protein